MLLDPPWDRVLQEDRVTLKCQGVPPAANSSIQWLHNGSLISSHTPTYTIRSARAEDSGEYRCGSNISSLSDPVQLQVRVGESACGTGNKQRALRSRRSQEVMLGNKTRRRSVGQSCTCGLHPGLQHNVRAGAFTMAGVTSAQMCKAPCPP